MAQAASGRRDGAASLSFSASSVVRWCITEMGSVCFVSRMMKPEDSNREGGPCNKLCGVSEKLMSMAKCGMATRIWMTTCFASARNIFPSNTFAVATQCIRLGVPVAEHPALAVVAVKMMQVACRPMGVAMDQARVSVFAQHG